MVLCTLATGEGASDSVESGEVHLPEFPDPFSCCLSFVPLPNLQESWVGPALSGLRRVQMPASLVMCTLVFGFSFSSDIDSQKMG